MLHWRLLIAAIVLAFAFGLTAPITGVSSSMVWAGESDDPGPEQEDPDDP
jgi:hypothetical protein